MLKHVIIWIMCHNFFYFAFKNIAKPRVEKLNALVGKYVNLEYMLPNGNSVKILDDSKTYLGNQLESEFGGERYFGVIGDVGFLLVCTYDKDGLNPELVLYKKR